LRRDQDVIEDSLVSLADYISPQSHEETEIEKGDRGNPLLPSVRKRHSTSLRIEISNIQFQTRSFSTVDLCQVTDQVTGEGILELFALQNEKSGDLMAHDIEECSWQILHWLRCDQKNSNETVGGR
jgi:hypothetical protein